MSDLIKREDVVKEFGRVFGDLGLTLFGVGGNDLAQVIANAIPSADRPQGEWIPCSERLPSEQREYLVTVTYEGDTYVECLHYGKPTMANREVKGECFYDSDDEWGDIVYDTEAIAWMPLPNPYGEREGE